MMLPMTSLATAAAGAVVVVLSGASMSNMYETFSLARNHNNRSKNNKLLPTPAHVTSRSANWESIDEAIHELQAMSRRDLISLYLDCEPPDINDLAATSSEQTNDNWVYDGYLLSNGRVLTTVTNFITNKLFGRGLKWLGKAYFSSNNSSACIGKNRFCRKQNTEQKSKKGIVPDDLLDRTFDYSIEQAGFTSGSSLVNRYSPHCSLWSPMSLIWRGMVDELRVIPLSIDAQCDSDDVSRSSEESKKRVMLLLGMGYFTWSGGPLNSAPFCLVAKQGK